MKIENWEKYFLVNKASKNEDINYTKWYIAELINYVLYNQNILSEVKKELISVINDIYELSKRENMNNIIYLQSRRKKANSLMILFEEYFRRWEVSKDDFSFLKKCILNVKLENFSQMLLPKTSGIIRPKNFKTEEYLNFQKIVDSKVLEPREYIWIVPEAKSDLDAPSFVTAETPAKYEQPWHDHADNWEITFYAWRSNWKYMLDWKEYILEADFWDFIIFPPKTFHTIENPNDFPVKNMSVKLPTALLDRWKEFKNTGWAWFIQKMQEISPWVREARFELQEVPYFSRLFSFDENVKNHKISPKNKSMLYVLWWEFIISWLEEEVSTLSDSSVVLLDSLKEVEITSLRKKWNIYMIELLDNWKEFSAKKD